MWIYYLGVDSRYIDLKEILHKFVTKLNSNIYYASTQDDIWSRFTDSQEQLQKLRKERTEGTQTPSSAARVQIRLEPDPVQPDPDSSKI